MRWINHELGLRENALRHAFEDAHFCWRVPKVFPVGHVEILVLANPVDHSDCIAATSPSFAKNGAVHVPGIAPNDLALGLDARVVNQIKDAAVIEVIPHALELAIDGVRLSAYHHSPQLPA